MLSISIALFVSSLGAFVLCLYKINYVRMIAENNMACLAELIKKLKKND